MKIDKDRKTYIHFVKNGGLVLLRRTRTIAAVKLADQIKSNAKSYEELLHNKRLQIKVLYLQKILALSFNPKSVLKISKKFQRGRSISLPFCKIILKQLHIEGFRINFILSYFYFIIFFSKYCLRSYSKALEFLLLTRVNRQLRLSKTQINSLIVAGESINEPFSLFQTSTKTKNFYNWIKENIIKQKNNYLVLHGIKFKSTGSVKGQKLVYLKNHKFPLTKKRYLTTFIKCFFRILISPLNIIFAKPEELFLLDEIVKDIWNGNSFLATQTLKLIYTENAGVIRPLWSYNLSKLGSEVYMVFTSTYDSPKTSQDLEPREDLWAINTWQNFFVCDEYQEKFINLSGVFPKTNKVLLKSFPDFVDSGEPLRIQVKASTDALNIAMFDFSTSNTKHFGFSTYNDVGYMDHETNHRFIKLGLRLQMDLGATILYKPKRSNDLNSYLSSCDECEETISNYFYQLPASTGIKAIFELCENVISLPFTTVAFQAAAKSKNSILFDPIGNVMKNDSAARGLLILSTMNEVIDYFIKLKNRKKL